MENTEEADVHVQEDKINRKWARQPVHAFILSGLLCCSKGKCPWCCIMMITIAYRATTLCSRIMWYIFVTPNECVSILALCAAMMNAEWKPGQIHSGDVSICIEPEGSDFEAVIYKTLILSARSRFSCLDFEQCFCAEKRLSGLSEKMGARSDIDRDVFKFCALS